MSAFAGMVVFSETQIDQGWGARLTSIVGAHGAGRPRVHKAARAVIVQSGTAQVRPAQGGRSTAFAASARLHNGAELAAELGEPGMDDPALIRCLFEARGDFGLAQLLGGFSFAHWDETAGTLTLGRDCNGERPLFFHRGDGFVAFASYLPDLLALPNVPRELDQAMVANFLALNHREYERTLYLGVDRVPTRTRVTITRDGVRMQRYWSPRLDAPPPCGTDREYVERARELFDRAVARCLKDTPRVAILTSGGLDSSAVAATAARIGHGDVTCYTGVPPEGFTGPLSATGYMDERPKVEALGRMHPSLMLRFIAPEGVHRYQHDGARLFARLGLPMRNPSNMGWFAAIDDAIQGDGHRVTLNGSMGNYGLTWTGQNAVRSLAAKGRFSRMFREASAMGRHLQRPVWRVLAAELARASPRWIQDLHLRLRGHHPEDIGRYSLLRPGAVEALNLRRQWRDSGFDPRFRDLGGALRLRARQIYDQGQLMRDCQAMSPLWKGVEIRDPHADRDLLEFCLCVPEEQYQRGGVQRWFGRQVFADRLPPEILNERLIGQQSPNWFNALTSRRESIAIDIERLETSPLGARLIDVTRLKRLYAEWPTSVDDAEKQKRAYRLGLNRAVHVAQFIRWVEGGNG